MKLSPRSSNTDARHYGIDALRILATYMVLVLHILGLGGVIDATAFPEARFIAAWTLEVAAYCAVNCYALITGYLMINCKYRYTNLALLWLQVVLYGILGTVLFYFFKPGSVSKVDLLLSPFPVFKKTHWYFSSYFLLFLLIPLINRGFHSLNRRQAKVMCLMIILVLSVMPTLINVDTFQLGGGFSPLWLIALYLIGASIRKFGFGQRIRSRWLILGYGVSVLLSVGVYLLLHLDAFSVLLKVWRKSMLILYTAPTILFNGIALFLLSLRLRIKSRWLIKFIRLVSPVTFGVYILHAHRQLAEIFLLKNQFAPLADYPIPLMLGCVLLGGLGMFVFFGVIDGSRIWLFRMLKLKKRLLALEEKYIGDLWAQKEDTK